MSMSELVAGLLSFRGELQKAGLVFAALKIVQLAYLNTFLADRSALMVTHNVCMYKIIYVPTAPGIKMRHAFFSLQFRLKLGFFLGDDSLRCLSCAGKFGNIDLDRRCAVRGLILSDDLLQIYLKALVSADNYTRSPLGRRRASGSSGDRGKSRAGVAAQAETTTTPRSTWRRARRSKGRTAQS